MIFAMILGVLMGAGLTIFALENANIVTVSLFSSQFTGPLAIIIMSVIGVSIVACLLALLPSLIRAERRMRVLEQQKKMLANELAKYQITIPIAPPSQTTSPYQIVERDKVYVG